MTKQEAITAMQRGEKVTHKYFTSDEWITINDYCQIEDESGYRHEQDSFWLDRGEQFDSGWELFEAPSEGENDVLHDVVGQSEQLPDDLDHDPILDGDDPHALGLRP